MISDDEKIQAWLTRSKCPLCGAALFTDGYLMACSRWGPGKCMFRAKLERF